MFVSIKSKQGNVWQWNNVTSVEHDKDDNTIHIMRGKESLDFYYMVHIDSVKITENNYKE